MISHAPLVAVRRLPANDVLCARVAAKHGRAKPKNNIPVRSSPFGTGKYLEGLKFAFVNKRKKYIEKKEKEQKNVNSNELGRGAASSTEK